MRYNHNQVLIDGFLFDSEMEADYYELVSQKMKNGEINGFKIHPEYVIIPPFNYFGHQVKATVYTPDFSYVDGSGQTVAIEVKGFPTPDFEIRAKLFKSVYPNILLKVMAYSKATGWLELKDYKKARRSINADKAVKLHDRRVAEVAERLTKAHEALAKAQTQWEAIANPTKRKEGLGKRIEALNKRIGVLKLMEENLTK